MGCCPRNNTSWNLIPATRPVVNAVQKQQNPTLPSSTHKKPPSACGICSGWHFAQKCPFKTHHCRKDIKRDSAPHRCTKWYVFQVKPKICVSKTERPLCSVTNRHCFEYNPHLTETMENQWPASSNTYNTCNAECIGGLCLHHWRIASSYRNWGQNSIWKDLHTRFET